MALQLSVLSLYTELLGVEVEHERHCDNQYPLL